MSEERLIDIETKIAFQERAIKELNDVVYEQQKQIDQLNATCRFLLNRIEEVVETTAGNTLEDEKPPHY